MDIYAQSARGVAPVVSRVRRKVSEGILPPRGVIEKRSIRWERTRFVFAEVLEGRLESNRV
jgi:hypothetical protein